MSEVVCNIAMVGSGSLAKAEISFLMGHQHCVTASDVDWRRTKCGLRMIAGQIEALNRWMEDRNSLRGSAQTASE